MSEQNQSSQEKSHEASPAKLERARKKGDLPRSQDLQTAMAYLGFCVVVLLMGGWSAVSMAEVLTAFLARPGLGGLAELVEGSGRTMRTIRRGVAFSLAYNLVGGALAMAGLIHPLAAAVLMPASSLTVVLVAWKSRSF